MKKGFRGKFSRWFRIRCQKRCFCPQKRYKTAETVTFIHNQALKNDTFYTVIIAFKDQNMNFSTLWGGFQEAITPFFQIRPKMSDFQRPYLGRKSHWVQQVSWSNAQKFWPAALFLLKKSEIQLKFEKMSYFVMAFSCELEKISTKNNKIFACGANGAKMSDINRKITEGAKKMQIWLLFYGFLVCQIRPKMSDYQKQLPETPPI